MDIPALLKIRVFSSCNCRVICHQFFVSISCLPCTSLLTDAFLSGRCDWEKMKRKRARVLLWQSRQCWTVLSIPQGTDSLLQCLGALRDRFHSPGCCLPHPSASPGTAWGISLQPPEFLASLQSSSDPCWRPKSGMCLLGIGSGWSQRSFEQLGADKV